MWMDLKGLWPGLLSQWSRPAVQGSWAGYRPANRVTILKQGETMWLSSWHGSIYSTLHRSDSLSFVSHFFWKKRVNLIQSYVALLTDHPLFQPATRHAVFPARRPTRICPTCDCSRWPISTTGCPASLPFLDGYWMAQLSSACASNVWDMGVLHVNHLKWDKWGNAQVREL